MVDQSAFMLYHSTLRNIASYSALALGSLGFLRFYHNTKSNKRVYMMAVLLCLCIFMIPLSIAFMYAVDVQSYDLPQKWKLLAMFVLGVVLLMMGFGAMTLYDTVST
jgi:hypothetical protein